MYEAFVDDSSSTDGDRKLFLAAYINTTEQWRVFSNRWLAALQAEPSIHYLKMSEANYFTAVARTSDRAIEALQQFGGFLGKVFGTVPEDTVGLFGDYLRHLRIRNFSRMQQRTEEIADAVILKTLRERGSLAMKPDVTNNLSAATSLSPDEISVSLNRLVELSCAEKHQPGYETYYLAPYGRLLLNACV